MWVLLVGCAPGAFTEEEAHAAFEAVTSVNEHVYAEIWARTQPLDALDTDTAGASAKSMQWHTGADGGSFDGTLEGPGSWSGAVALDGTYGLTQVNGDDWAYVWDMGATYADVAYGDLTLDGTVAWDIEATYGVSTFTHTSAVVGELVGGGAATGTGTIDTKTRVTLSGGRYLVTTQGTVGGFDVSRTYDATGFGL
ncbi:MAG: hypothetical protein ACK4YP_27525 [Myxococcota bacterium]